VSRLPFDIYSLMRPVLFKIDPEMAHIMAMEALRFRLLPSAKRINDPVLRTEVAGLKFNTPIGLGAGMDKQATAIQGLLDLGFGFLELGTVTPLPQPGNPRPRMWRIPEAQALINRFGFNSVGREKVAARVDVFFEKRRNKNLPCDPVGVNIGSNKTSVDIPADYTHGVLTFAPYADYLAVNISSPNTPGLRDMQRRAPMLDLLKKVLDARARSGRKPPVFVKIAPDQTPEQLKDIADVILESGVDGVIVGNTTVSRPDCIPAEIAKEAGGLSGKPLTEMATQRISEVYKLTEGKVPIIGCGGIFTGEDAYAKIRAGASLIQVFTSMVYRGPYVAYYVANELAELLRRDGFANVADAVGVDVR